MRRRPSAPAFGQMDLAMQIQLFRSSSEFREWLASNHDKVHELWVGFYKKNSGKAGISYPQAVDEALCFGWIDGIKKALDDVSYTHRFTPRKPKSFLEYGEHRTCPRAGTAWTYDRARTQNVCEARRAEGHAVFVREKRVQTGGRTGKTVSREPEGVGVFPCSTSRLSADSHLVSD